MRPPPSASADSPQPSAPSAKAPHPLSPGRATAALALILGLGIGILLWVEHMPRRISVDVLDLLPRDEQDPSIRLARQTVSGRFGRTVLIAVSDTVKHRRAPVEAAAMIASELKADRAFSDVFAGLDDASKQRLEQWFFSRRLALRLPVWLDAMTARWQKIKGESAGPPDATWLADTAAGDLQDFQSSDTALALQDRLPADPLLLIPGLLSVFGDEDKAAAGSMAGGALTKDGPDHVAYALIQAETQHSQLEEAGQQPVFAALDRALAHARAKFGPGISLEFSGVCKFAADTREHGLREISLLTWVSLALSFVLLFWAFRRVTVFIYLVLPIATATVWSLVVCFAIFERMHVVAITFTTVLVGVALDYGIYTLIHARQSAGGLVQSLREIRWPLIAGCLTSVGGFAFMTLTNLPMLQQMGVAVALGLIFSLALDFVYLPWIPALQPWIAEAPVPGSRSLGPRRLDLGGLRYPFLVLIALGTAASLTLASGLRWSDDIRTLSTMSPRLEDEQTFLRQLFGQGNHQHIVLTFGHDLNEAFANLEGLNVTLAGKSTDPGDHFLNLGQLLPGASLATRCQVYFRDRPGFADDLRKSLGQNFNADAFAPFWTDWDAWNAANARAGAPPTPAQSIEGLRAVIPLPLQSLWNEEQPGAAWLATTVSDSLYQKLPAAALAAPNMPVDQTQTINGALRRYRIEASERAGIGLAAVAFLVLVVYGWRRALFMLAIPAVSILLAMAVLGFIGKPLGLLHVVALLLGFCLASDYSIFLGSPGDLPRSTHRAVVLAASTALLSFGVLSLSSLEALKNICLTVTLVIVFVLVSCEVGYRMFVRRSKA